MDDATQNYWDSLTAAPQRQPKERVPDDWDDDDDETSGSITDTQQNKKIWEDANSKLPTPMPPVVISASYGTPLIPTAAFQAESRLKILRRPKDVVSDQPAIQASDPVESLKEKEARYQAARDRIFGRSPDAHNGVESESVSRLQAPKGDIKGSVSEEGLLELEGEGKKN